MNTRTSTSLHFMLAIAVSFVLSVSLATAASMVGMMPESRVDPHKPAFWTPLTDNLRNAAAVNAASTARNQSSTPTQASDAPPRAGQ